MTTALRISLILTVALTCVLVSASTSEWWPLYSELFAWKVAIKPKMMLEQLMKLHEQLERQPEHDGQQDSKVQLGLKDVEALIELGTLTEDECDKAEVWTKLNKALSDYQDFINIRPYLSEAKNDLVRVCNAVYMKKLTEEVERLSQEDKDKMKKLKSCVTHGAEWLDDIYLPADRLPQENLVHGAVCFLESALGEPLTKALYQQNQARFIQDLSSLVLDFAARVEQAIKVPNQLFDRLNDQQAYNNDLFWAGVKRWHNSYNIVSRLMAIEPTLIFQALPEGQRMAVRPQTAYGA